MKFQLKAAEMLAKCFPWSNGILLLGARQLDFMPSVRGQNVTQLNYSTTNHQRYQILYINRSAYKRYKYI